MRGSVPDPVTAVQPFTSATWTQRATATRQSPAIIAVDFATGTPENSELLPHPYLPRKWAYTIV